MNPTRKAAVVERLKTLRMYRNLTPATDPAVIDVLDALVDALDEGPLDAVRRVRPERGDVVFVRMSKETTDDEIRHIGHGLNAHFNPTHPDPRVAREPRILFVVARGLEDVQRVVPPPRPNPGWLVEAWQNAEWNAREVPSTVAVTFNPNDPIDRAVLDAAYRLFFGPKADDAHASDTERERVRAALCAIGLTGPDLFWKAWHAVHDRKVHDAPVTWTPQPGMQTYLLTCTADEILLAGGRGAGKTDACLGDWIAYANRHGMNAHGVWYVRSMVEFEEVKEHMEQLFGPLGAEYSLPRATWVWPFGATLCVRPLAKKVDIDRDAGREFTWAAFDNVGRWATPDLIDAVVGTMRSPSGAPNRVLMTTAEPSGWVQDRFGIVPLHAMRHKGTTRVLLPAAMEHYQKAQEATP